MHLSGGGAWNDVGVCLCIKGFIPSSSTLVSSTTVPSTPVLSTVISFNQHFYFHWGSAIFEFGRGFYGDTYTSVLSDSL